MYKFRQLLYLFNAKVRMKKSASKLSQLLSQPESFHQLHPNQSQTLSAGSSSKNKNTYHSVREELSFKSDHASSRQIFSNAKFNYSYKWCVAKQDLRDSKVKIKERAQDKSIKARLPAPGHVISEVCNMHACGNLQHDCGCVSNGSQRGVAPVS